MPNLASPAALLERVFPPMLASSAKRPPSETTKWWYEPKYDGFRALCCVVGGEVAVWSRKKVELGSRFPGIETALDSLDVENVVIDGEIVALDDTGRPRFHLVQHSSPEAFLVAFDLLWLDGIDLRGAPIEVRRETLERLVRKGSGRVRLADRFKESGEEALAEAKARGIEGIVAKKAGSIYHGGRSDSWLKIRAWNEQELVVVGFTHTTRRDDEIGALLLAYRDGGDFRFAGSVGTGFTLRQRQEIHRALAEFVLDKPPVVNVPPLPEPFWVEPRLVAQVRFTEWTPDGMLRHPSLVGFRSDKLPEEVVREDRRRSDSVQVALTTPHRLLWPRDKLSKTNLADYYEAMSDVLIPALEGRPLALEHWNEGIDGASWYQQDVSRDAAEWMTLVETPLRTGESKTSTHLVVDRPETLRWLAQRSVLTIHSWASRVGTLEVPDWVVIDLDPATGEGIDQAVRAALVFRRLLDELEIPSFPKTSGKRGIHVLIPLEKGHSFNQAASFAERICSAVSSKVDFITVERSIDKRKGRLYADSLQNAYGKTIVAPYSPRGIDGAPVSAPLRWSEVTKRLDPGRYNLRSMEKRVEKMGDLFQEGMRTKARLPSLG